MKRLTNLAHVHILIKPQYSILVSYFRLFLHTVVASQSITSVYFCYAVPISFTVRKQK